MHVAPCVAKGKMEARVGCVFPSRHALGILLVDLLPVLRHSRATGTWWARGMG